MKKILTKTFIASIILAIITIMFCDFSIKFSKNSDNSYLNQVTEKMEEQEEIGDVEGYAYIMEAITATVADAGEVIGIIIFIFLIPICTTLLSVIFQTSSKLLNFGKEKKWKNTIGIVFLYFSIILQIMLCLNLVFDLLVNLKINKIYITVALLLNLAGVIIYILELKNINKLNIVSGEEPIKNN